MSSGNPLSVGASAMPSQDESPKLDIGQSFSPVRLIFERVPDIPKSLANYCDDWRFVNRKDRARIVFDCGIGKMMPPT